MDPAYPRTGKRLPAILGSAKKPGRLAAHDGLGGRVWLVVDDVHELARRSRTSRSKKLQARSVAYRFVCCNLRSTHYSSGHTPWSGRNPFGQGVTHVRLGRARRAHARSFRHLSLRVTKLHQLASLAAIT